MTGRISTFSHRLTGLILLLVSISLAGCGANAGDEGDGIRIVTSTSVIAALAEAVGGDAVRVEPLIGAGVDPHTFELTPGDIRKLADAELLLLNGLELDDFLIDDATSANSAIEIVVVSAGIEPLPLGGHEEHDGEETHVDEDHEHEHGEFDPHIWQDPLRVKAMVENIADALAAADPDHAAVYRDNAADYQRTLDETHAEIQALIDGIPAERRKLVTNHDAFGYFAARYGLEIVGTVIPGGSSEAEPSASDIAHLTELIHHEGVSAIFAEALLDPRVSEVLAADTGIKIVYGLYSDQLGTPGSGAETVHGMLLANARKISDGLK